MKKLILLILLLALPVFAGQGMGPGPGFYVSTGGGGVSIDTGNALSNNIALCYVFQEGSGTTVEDLTTNNNTGTLNNATWVTTPHGGVNLSQASSYVSTLSQVLDNADTNYSILIFGKTPSTLDSSGFIFDHENGANWRTGIECSEYSVIFYSRRDGSTTLDTQGTGVVLTAATEFKIVVTRDGTATDEKKYM